MLIRLIEDDLSYTAIAAIFFPQGTIGGVSSRWQRMKEPQRKKTKVLGLDQEIKKILKKIQGGLAR